MPLLPRQHVSHHAPETTRDLRPSERRFLSAMQQLGHGRFESVPIHHGELVLDPWPTTVRSVKFGNATANQPAQQPGEFELKRQVSDFFGQVRAMQSGVIRMLDVRGGLPFSMEIQHAGQQ